jgi:NAD(P)-dependent dehydrogenase (short-subunit alcohol dehydrogenase family)
MTKAALNMLARSLALELAPCRIAINALAPGATITERTLQDDPHYEQTWKPLIPDGRVARPGDIARAALFLLSADAEHITGHTLVIDGGWSDAGCYPKQARGERAKEAVSK